VFERAVRAPQAQPVGPDAFERTVAAGSYQYLPASPVQVSSDGFDWSDALIGAGVALGISSCYSAASAQER